jgi:hypothetical protein
MNVGASCFALLFLLAIPSESPLAAPTQGPGGRLSLYVDAALSDSTLLDSAPQIVDIYVVHRIVGGDNAYAIRFRLSASSGFTGTWLEDVITSGITAVGTSPGGIALGYNACREGEVLLLRARYQLGGTSSPCSYLEVVPYPGVPYIETMTCSFESLVVDGGQLLVNCPVPVGPTTWGRIKALYRE